MKQSRIVIATLVLCLAAPAAAEDRAAAEQLFREGAAAYKSGKFDEASQRFDAAYDNLRAPEIAFSAAQAHRLQYEVDRDPAHLRRALELYRVYVEGAPNGAKRKDALVYIDRLGDALKKAEPAGAAVAQQKPSVFVSIALASARVTIDGKDVEANTSIEVPPGEHVVAASAEGYLPEERKIRVGNGAAPVPFELKPRPATLAIRSQPDARITVDGRSVLLRGGQTEVPAGTRWITVSARGRRPVSREVVLEPGKQLTLDAPLAPTTQRRAVRWVVIGSGALLAASITSAAIAISADFAAADLRDQNPLPTDKQGEYVEARDSRDRWRTRSILLGVGAAAVGAVAAVMYYADEPSADALPRPIEQKPDAGFTPIALGDGLGLGLGYAGGF
ncbi:MAG TPA: hypothetical protein VNO30_11945 [Kofleriaceae bacterium]|nr:hypothetical protein [Kofleriaceae bacterium]